MNKKKTIVIEIDDREPEMEILTMLENWNVTFERKRLNCGDYRYKNLIIERKTMDDFCSSILDGRLLNQTKNMLELQEQGAECFIIIIGPVSSRVANIHENCVFGKVCSLVYKHNIRVIMCETEFQFLYCLRNLCDKHDKKEGDKDEMQKV